VRRKNKVRVRKIEKGYENNIVTDNVKDPENEREHERAGESLKE